MSPSTSACEQDVSIGSKHDIFLTLLLNLVVFFIFFGLSVWISG